MKLHIFMLTFFSLYAILILKGENVHLAYEYIKEMVSMIL